MTKPEPVVDQAVSKGAVIGPLGLLLVIAALGLIILGARHAASLIRSLDQDVSTGLPDEPPRSE